MSKWKIVNVSFAVVARKKAFNMQGIVSVNVSRAGKQFFEITHFFSPFKPCIWKQMRGNIFMLNRRNENGKNKNNSKETT